MSIADMKGVTNNLNQMAEQMKTLYEQSQDGHIINSEDIANIEKMNREIQDLVKNSRDAKEQLAGTISDLGMNFSSVLENIQAIKNNNPSADISHQFDEASSKISQFISIFQQLSQTKLEVNTDNVQNVIKLTEEARQSIEDMQSAMSKGGNTNVLEPVLNTLKAISDTFKDGNISNQFSSLANSVDSVNRAFGDQGQVIQSSSMSIKALSDQMGELAKASQNMNSGLSDVFAKITGPGTNVTPFTEINEQIKQITDSLGTLQGAIKNEGTWNNPEALGELQTKKIEQALQKVLGKQEEAFSQALGKVSSNQLESTLKDYVDFRDNLIKNIVNMRDILSDPKQLPEIPVGASDELVDKIKSAREGAQQYLKDVQEQLSKTKFGELEKVYGQSVENDFHNIMGQGGADRNDMLMRMATGQSLGNNFDHSMDRIGTQAARIHNSAIVLDSAAHDPNSGMTSYQRNAVDYHGVAEQSQQLARMQQEYSSVKDQFSGAYTNAINETDPSKRAEAMDKAKKRYSDLMAMHNKIKDHAINIGKSFKVSSPEDKERLGKEAAELYDYVRGIIRETAASGDSLFAMGQTLNIPKPVLDGLKEGTNGIKDMKSAMEDAEKQSKGLWSSMQDGLKEMMSPLRAIGKGLGILGIGTLGGGPLAMLTKSLQYHTEQGRDIYESQRTGLQYGLDGSYGLGNTVDRLHKGAELHQRSGGRIGIQELNKAYDSAMGSVGGRYGVSAEQGSSEMNSLVNNTFMMQKMYGIDQSTMNDAYKTFYKDMGQSADEAANSIAKLTQTAAAANIPAGQYLKMVSGIAQQFMKIGLSGKDAENMMGNFIHQGMRAEVAQSMSQQTGQAMGNFAQNKSMVGYASAMMGGDPFAGMASAAYSHEANGKERDGWSQDVSKMMDTMTKQMDLVTGGNPNLRRIVLTDHFKNMGYDQRGASTLTSAFMSGNHEVFQKALEEQNKRMDNPNASLEEVNGRLEQQLKTISGNLSAQDQLSADINRNLYELAFKTGPKIDDAIRELSGVIMKFVGSIGKLSEGIANFISGISKSGIFQHAIKPGLELAAEHPIVATAGTYAAWKLAKGKVNLPKVGGAGGVHGGTGLSANILKAIARNPKTAIFGTLAAGALGYSAIGSSHSREGDVEERIYDKLHAIYQAMINGEINLSGTNAGGIANHSSKASEQPSYSPSDDNELSVGSSAAVLGSMAIAGRANGTLERFIGTAKHADDYSIFGKMAMQGEEGAAGLAVRSGAKLMRNAFAKNAVTGLITEGAFGAYDIYDHKQKGDLLQGDANRVGANAAVNLGYMATGAAIGSIVPGIGTVAGGIIGGAVGLGVDMFSEKDANGKGFNDRAKDMLYSLSTGGDTLDDLEKRRGSLNEGEKIKAKLQMLGYSDEEAKEMSKNLIENKDELEKHGVNFSKMTVEQKAAMAIHGKELGLNKKALEDTTGQGKKICEDMKDLASAIRNTPLGDKINKEAKNKVDANRAKVEHELDNTATLSTMFNHKSFDLKQWREKLSNDLKANPEDLSKQGEIEDVDKKLEKLQRAKYLLDNGEEQRREDHGASWDNLNIFTRGGQSREEYINNQLAQDRKDVDEMRGLYSGEYVDKRVADGALNDQQSADQAADQVENAITNPGGNGDNSNDGATQEAQDNKEQKADDSRKQAAGSTAEKIVKQNQKQEELNKEGNKLTHTLIDQEKLLFKALEASGNKNTKALHVKLEEIRLLLDKIQFNTANMNKGGAGGYKSNAYNELKRKDGQLAKWVDEASSKYNVSKDLIAAVMKAESSFKRGLGANGAGAIGLMQVTSDKGTGLNPYNDHDNIQIGTKYLKEMLQKYNGDEKLALAAYNAGPGNVDEWIEKYGTKDWGIISQKLKSNKSFKETTDYVSKIYGFDGSNASGILGTAQKYLGMDYVLGGDGVNGTDCGKLVQDVYAANGIDIGTRRADFQADEFKKRGGYFTDSSQLQPGDSVFMKGSDPGDNGVGHVGIYAGNGQMIEAPRSGLQVRYASLEGRDVVGYGAISVFGASGSGNGAYTPSQGSTYDGNYSNVDNVKTNLDNAAQNGQAPSSSDSGQTQSGAADNTTSADAGTSAPGISSAVNSIGDARAALNSKTGKAFYDGSLIRHHLDLEGGGIWYGNQSGNTLNWNAIQAAMQEEGGAGTELGGHRAFAALSREARINSDAAMGVTVQNPVTARNLASITPVNTEIAKDMAKNIEDQNIPTTITNSNLIKAATDFVGEEKAGREISVNITIDKAADNFVEGFGDALKEVVSKLGARVEKIEERSVQNSQTARTALHTGISQRQQSQDEQYSGR